MSQRGFTLIESLVASTVVSMLLLASAAMTLASVAHLGRSGEETTATTLAQQRVEWLRNQGFSSTALNAGTSTEVLTGGYAGYSRVTVIQDDVPRADVKQLTVTTSTPSGRSVQVVALIAEGV